MSKRVRYFSEQSKLVGQWEAWCVLGRSPMFYEVLAAPNKVEELAALRQRIFDRCGRASRFAWWFEYLDKSVGDKGAILVQLAAYEAAFQKLAVAKQQTAKSNEILDALAKVGKLLQKTVLECETYDELVEMADETGALLAQNYQDGHVELEEQAREVFEDAKVELAGAFFPLTPGEAEGGAGVAGVAEGKE